MEAVADILAERTRQPRGMNRTVVVSVLAHAVLLTAFLLLTSLGPPRATEREVMTISLGGAPGPRAGGMTPMGGRPVQAPPAEEAPRRAPVTQEGSAVAETGARGVGFGLTTGGGGTGGYLDVGNFCCPEYLTTMLQLIQRNWTSKQEVAGQTIVKFTIQRDGRLTSVEVERPSGFFALDQTAQRALLVTRQLPPLPAQYTENDLTVHLIFRYER